MDTICWRYSKRIGHSAGPNGVLLSMGCYNSHNRNRGANSGAVAENRNLYITGNQLAVHHVGQMGYAMAVLDGVPQASHSVGGLTSTYLCE